MRFLAKMCFYFKHFLYLCKRNNIIYLVVFVDGKSYTFWELGSSTSNATSERREADCLAPLIFEKWQQAT